MPANGSACTRQRVARNSPDSVPRIPDTDRSAAAIRAADGQRASAPASTILVRFEKQDALNARQRSGHAGLGRDEPTYGVRLGDAGESRRLMAGFGDALRERFGGWHVALLAPAQLERAMRITLEPGFRTTNGGLRVQFLAGLVTNGQGQTDV